MIAFIFDDRLPRDRRIVFQRTVTLLRSKFDIEILPSSYHEDDLLEHLKKNEYDLVLLPWYKYLSWKKIDALYGSLTMERTVFAGYFADPVLQFEFGAMPNYNRSILLDFYRFNQFEIELMLDCLTHPDKRAGLYGVVTRNSPVYTGEWLEIDALSTRCVDEVLALPLFHKPKNKDMLHHYRFFMTGLWSFIFPEPRAHPQPIPHAEIQMSEFYERIAIKVLFKNSNYTLKQSMEWMWPEQSVVSPAMRELSTYADMIRIHHYPETQQIELTAFFVHSKPSIHFPNEVRGFWIEPLKLHHLKKYDILMKLVSIRDALSLKKKVA